MNRQKWQEWTKTKNRSRPGNRTPWVSARARPGRHACGNIEQLRAGQVYNRFMFNTRQEAEEFATQMARAEPDLFSGSDRSTPGRFGTRCWPHGHTRLAAPSVVACSPGFHDSKRKAAQTGVEATEY